jgi:hypothetical protein
VSWFDDAAAANRVEVPALLTDQVVDLVAAITSNGALVSMGCTSDGGAFGVTVTMDGRWRREYFRDAEELTAWLIGAASAVEEEAQRLAASPAPRKRSRRSD